MKPQTYIIGGGITGLLAAYYLKLPLISKNIGGQLSHKYSLGPRLLHFLEPNIILLKDLNYNGGKLDIKRHRIGYFMTGVILDDVNDECRRMYYCKSRDLNYSFSVPNSVMSDNQSIICAINVDFNELINKLYNNIKSLHIQHNVKSIDPVNRILVLDNNETLKYDKLIVTIPFNVFLRIFDNGSFYNLFSLKYIGIKYVIGESVVVNEFFGNYSYLYFIDDEQLFHRITKIKDNLFCIDFVDKYSDEEIIKECENHDINVKDIIHIKNAQILSLSETDKIRRNTLFKDCVFIGRYAEWEHGIKIQDTLTKIWRVKNELL